MLSVKWTGKGDVTHHVESFLVEGVSNLLGIVGQGVGGCYGNDEHVARGQPGRPLRTSDPMSTGVLSKGGGLGGGFSRCAGGGTAHLASRVFAQQGKHALEGPQDGPVNHDGRGCAAAIVWAGGNGND